MQNDPQFNPKLNQFAMDLLQRAAQPQTPQDEELSMLLELSETDPSAAEEQFFQRYVAGVVLFDEMAEQRRFSDAFLDEMRQRKQQGMSMAQIAAIAPMVAEHSMNRMPGKQQHATGTHIAEQGVVQIHAPRLHGKISVEAETPIIPPKDKLQDHFNVRAAKQNVAEQRGGAAQDTPAGSKENGKGKKGAQGQRPQSNAPQVPQNMTETSTTQQSQQQGGNGMGIFGKVFFGGGAVAGTAGGIIGAVAVFNAI